MAVTIKKLSVEEATGRVYGALAEYTGWKFLKSQCCLKKTVGDIVFQIDFYSSKWNYSYESIEIQCELQLWCKKFDKSANVHSHVGYYTLKPEQKEWWDISDEEQLKFTIEELCKMLDEAVIPLCKEFEENFKDAAIRLADESLFNKYHIQLRFLDVYAGRENIQECIKNYLNSLTDAEKQQIESYKQGDRSKAWMINPSNLKYIIDNNLI